jgi:hypothetical protein
MRMMMRMMMMMTMTMTMMMLIIMSGRSTMRAFSSVCWCQDPLAGRIMMSVSVEKLFNALRPCVRTMDTFSASDGDLSDW